MNKITEVYRNIAKENYINIVMVEVLTLSLVFIENYRPYLTGAIIDLILKNSSDLRLYIVEMIIIIFLTVSLNYTQSIIMSKSIFSNENKLKKKYYDKLIKSNNFIELIDQSNEIVHNDITTISKTPYQILDILVYNICTFIFVIYVCIRINLYLTIVVIIIIPLLFIFNNKTSKSIKIYNLNLKDNIDKINLLLNQTKHNMPTIKSFEAYGFFSNILNSSFDSNYLLKNRISKKIISKNSIVEIFNYSLYIIILIISIWLINRGKLTVGKFVSFNSYSNILMGSIKAFNELIYLHRDFEISYNRYSSINAKLSIDCDKSTRVERDIPFAISLNAVGLKRNNTQILKNININFPEVGFVYVIGESGSGKTSFLNIIGKVITNFSGNITYKERCNSIGYVTQFPYIFDDTIINNILIGRNIDNYKLEDITKNLKIDYIFNKYGDKSIKNEESLSGGEKQRISLARALIGSPNILILDEYDTGLDEYTADLIYNYLAQLSSNILIVISTHNTRNILDYDKCVFLKNGEVVAFDNFNEIKKKMIYHSN